MITRLDHANIRTTKLKDMIVWYQDVLGFKEGWRPNFPFGGAWMYIEDFALVHLVEVEQPVETSENSSLEHVAFSAAGLAEFRAHLVAHSVACQEIRLEDAGIIQMNIHDPEGNHLHIDFALTEDK